MIYYEQLIKVPSGLNKDILKWHNKGFVVIVKISYSTSDELNAREYWRDLSPVEVIAAHKGKTVILESGRHNRWYVARDWRRKR